MRRMRSFLLRGANIEPVMTLFAILSAGGFSYIYIYYIYEVITYIVQCTRAL